jgi:hypothetical protein
LASSRKELLCELSAYNKILMCADRGGRNHPAPKKKIRRYAHRGNPNAKLTYYTFFKATAKTRERMARQFVQSSQGDDVINVFHKP